MDFYFVKLDVKNYIETNRKNILFCFAVIIVGMVLGLIIALTTDLVVVEESGNAYFVFLRGCPANLFVAIVFGLLLYFGLLVFSRLNNITRRFGFLVVLFRGCEFFNRLVLVLRYFGIRCFIGVILTLLLEVCVCIAFSFLYLLNNDERCCDSGRIFDGVYLFLVGLFAVLLILVGILLCLSYNFIALFT